MFISTKRAQALEQIESSILFSEPTIYDKWFLEFFTHVEALAKTQARDGLNLEEYTPGAVAALTDVFIDEEELWQIFTDTHEEGRTLCDFVTSQVGTTAEAELYCRNIFRCDACGIIDVDLLWSRGFNQEVKQCIDCSFV